MSDTDERKWSWWAIDLEDPEEEPEAYQLNEPTREGVIEAAQREWPGSWIAIVEATRDGPFAMRPFDQVGDCPLLEPVVEKFLDDNGARWGEDSEPPCLDLQALATVLNDAVEAFMTREHAALTEAAWAFTAAGGAEVLLLGPRAI